MAPAAVDVARAVAGAAVEGYVLVGQPVDVQHGQRVGAGHGPSSVPATGAIAANRDESHASRYDIIAPLDMPVT